MTTKNGMMPCPMCDTVLTWNPIPANYKADDVTHVYLCPECPFVGFEYFTGKNIDDLRAFLTK